jgi:hypothetical protein
MDEGLPNTYSSKLTAAKVTCLLTLKKLGRLNLTSAENKANKHMAVALPNFSSKTASDEVVKSTSHDVVYLFELFTIVVYQTAFKRQP